MMGPPTTEEPGRDKVPARTQPGTLQPVAPAGPPTVPAVPVPHSSPSAWRKRLIRLGLLVLLGLDIGLLVWRAQRPPEGTLIQPTVSLITETIASSGRVGGVTETVVGAQATGIVAELPMSLILLANCNVLRFQ
jgi:hypothetical protein